MSDYVPTTQELEDVYPTIEIAEYLWRINGKTLEITNESPVPPIYYVYLTNEYNRRLKEEQCQNK